MVASGRGLGENTIALSVFIWKDRRVLCPCASCMFTPNPMVWSGLRLTELLVTAPVLGSRLKPTEAKLEGFPVAVKVYGATPPAGTMV
jgi:hypothetical protein